MAWLRVPHDLSQVAHVDLLAAYQAGVEILLIVSRIAFVPVAGNRWGTTRCGTYQAAACLLSPAALGTDAPEP